MDKKWNVGSFQIFRDMDEDKSTADKKDSKLYDIAEWLAEFLNRIEPTLNAVYGCQIETIFISHSIDPESVTLTVIIARGGIKIDYTMRISNERTQNDHEHLLLQSIKSGAEKILNNIFKSKINYVEKEI